MANKNPIMDIKVVRLINIFEMSLYVYIDKAMPNKFRSTLVQQLLNTIGEMRQNALKALKYDINLFILEKVKYFEETEANIYNIELLLNDLNDLQQISNEAKARLDEKLLAVKFDIARLLNSMKSKYKDRLALLSDAKMAKMKELELINENI